MLNHADVANRPCIECQKWMYDEKGNKVIRGGRPVARPKGSPTPCWKCPKESPDKAKEHELSEKNWRALAYYQQCAAPLGERLAADAIVHRNHAVIFALMGAGK